MKTVIRALHGYRYGARTGPVVFAMLLLCATGRAEHYEVTVSVSDGRVAVTAIDAPLRAVLEALADEGMIDVTAMDALERRVDVESDYMRVQEVLRRLLRDYSYVYVDATDVSYLRILPSSGQHDSNMWYAGSRNQLDRIGLELTDSDPEIREEAVLSVADLDPDLAVSLLLPVSVDPDPAVREAAQAVLEDLDATDYAAADRLTE